MAKIRPAPRVNLSLSIDEVIAICMMLKVGKMFTRPKERKNVEAVLQRIDGRLESLGVPRDAIDKLVKL